MTNDVDKCYKCKADYLKTPVCINCGTIPLIDDDLFLLKQENESLRQENKELVKRLKSVETTLTSIIEQYGGELQ